MQFDIVVKNRSQENGDKVIITTELINCESKTLKELVLKIAEDCHENEDNSFISLTITKKINNN
ncbi:MAG: hypothetical protein LW595_06450 [Rickettsiales bacterium]|nr:hypothetical protein [Rickettsiales bacterium]